MHVVLGVEVADVRHLDRPLQDERLEGVAGLVGDAIVRVLEALLDVVFEPRDDRHVLRHVRRQHHFNDELAELHLLGVGHPVQEVAVLVPQDPERRREVVVLVRRLVVGVDGPLVVGLDQEVVVEPPMFVVVHRRGYQPCQNLKLPDKLPDAALGQDDVHRLDHVGNVRRVVVGVVLLAGFNGAEEVDELDVVEVELSDQVVLQEHVPAQHLEWQAVSLPLEVEDVELPIVRFVEARPQPG
mmetsp:Transcript_43513/g.103433  ORF Transcript_43513/g.103433 Transcript_43513/m.103433 type:complete len:241 (-) Transcript_43513:1368-2090(-)